MTHTIACDVTLPLGAFPLAVRFTSHARVTGIFGRSGVGKSSLLEAMIGLRPGARGRVVVDGRVWLDDTAGVCVPVEARDVGYVPQAGRLFPHLTVRGNLEAGERRARERDVDVASMRAHVLDVLELAPHLDKPVSVLSGGERQRVALARALCSAPRCLVLDEPLASLDVTLATRLLTFILRVREAFDVPMIVVSHAPLEIAALCEHVIALDAGRVIAEGTPHDVLADRAVLGEVQGRLRSVFRVEPVRGADDGSRVRIVGSDVEIVTRRAHVGAAAPWTLSIPADAVLLARDALSASTASNELRARVVHVTPHAPFGIVHLALAPGLPPLLAEVTDASLARLGIEVGADVRAVFKASSCALLEA